MNAKTAKTMTHDDYRTAARDSYTGCGGHYSDGDIDVDEDAVVSESDEGAYVAAWVWIPNAIDTDES
jgi:hypothetical protein